MRHVEPYSLWLGNADDLRNPAHFFDSDIQAVVDLAANEPFPHFPRDLTYCRFPLFDGGGNDPALLWLAIRTLSEMFKVSTTTAVCCSNGLSRSPAIAAAAMSVCDNIPLDDALVRATSSGHHDVSAALWQDVIAVCQAHNP